MKIINNKYLYINIIFNKCIWPKIIYTRYSHESYEKVFPRDTLYINIFGFNIEIEFPWSTSYLMGEEGFQTDDISRRYGFEFVAADNSNIPVECWMYFDKHYKIKETPIYFKWYTAIKYDASGNKYVDDLKNPTKGSKEFDKLNPEQKNKKSPYTYIRNNGDMQNTIAHYHVEYREWRPKWMMWQNVIKRSRREITVEFEDELGEQVNSWNGGVIGSDCEMKPNEFPIETLRRMEQERRFN